MPAATWDNVKRQYFTAKKALESARGDGIAPLQKVYDQAKKLYDEHPSNPSNRGKKRAQKKRF